MDHRFVLRRMCGELLVLLFYIDFTLIGEIKLLRNYCETIAKPNYSMQEITRCSQKIKYGLEEEIRGFNPLEKIPNCWF